MLYFILAVAMVRLADGVCFSGISDNAPRIVVKTDTAATYASCKIDCLLMANCESVFFVNPTTCYFLGNASTGHCGALFSRKVKTPTCPQYNLTSNYAKDPCLASATLSPELFTTSSTQICPNTPINGEDTARVYVVSVIFSNGSYGVFDNNNQGQITWDSTLTSWVYKYMSGRDVYVNEPIYAANFPQDCNCSPLPLEESTAGSWGATAAQGLASGACDSSYRGKFIVNWSRAEQTCDTCNDFILTCVYKMWIHVASEGSAPGQINTYAITNATCYY